MPPVYLQSFQVTGEIPQGGEEGAQSPEKQGRYFAVIEGIHWRSAHRRVYFSPIQ